MTDVRPAPSAPRPAAAHRAGRGAPRTERSPLPAGANTVTVICGAVMVGGLFLDGWAHSNEKPDSFFTPWHAVLYTGFLASGLWFAWIVTRPGGPWRSWAAVAPDGYFLGLLGALAFGVGGVVDMIWHSTLGIEVDEAALYSPPHLLLMTSGFLVLTTPVRSLWADSSIGRTAPWRHLAPALVGSGLASAMLAFMFMSHSVFKFRLDLSRGEWWALVSEGDREFFIAVDHGRFLISTLVFLLPVIMLLRRWQLPFGFVALCWTLVAALLSAIEEFDSAPTILAAATGGLFADLLIRRLRPSPQRVGALRLFGFLVPMLLWTTWFVVCAWRWTVVWPFVAVSGIVGLCGVVGIGSTLLVAPPALPVEGAAPLSE